MGGYYYESNEVIEAFHAGYQTGLAGRVEALCPYFQHYDSDRYLAWHRGFENGQEERKMNLRKSVEIGYYKLTG